MEALVDGLIHSSTLCIHFIMATVVNRISVVRIPRQYANQINPADVQDQRPKPLLLTREETPTHDAQHSRLQDVIIALSLSLSFLPHQQSLCL